MIWIVHLAHGVFGSVIVYGGQVFGEPIAWR